MLTEVQQIILKCLLGPEDKTAFKRYRKNEQKQAQRQRNRSKFRERNRIDYARDRENICARRRKKWAQNPEEARECKRASRARNPEKTRKLGAIYAQRRRARLAKDPEFQMLRRLRRKISRILSGKTKSGKTLELTGCTIPEFRAHLESQFRPGMTWENHGPVWHIDHIRPCASFDLLDPAQQRECFHYSNQQPLFAKENLQKGDKWPAS